MTEIELNGGMGCIPSPIDIRDYKINPATCAQTFPEQFSLKLPSAKDQGYISSCVAHALALLVEYFNTVQLNDDDKMSVGFIYGNRLVDSYTGAGLYLRNAIKCLQKYGDCKLTDFPENIEVTKVIELFTERFPGLKDVANAFRISSFFQVSTESEIKTALTNYGPVVFSIPWYSDISLDKDYIMQSAKDKDKISGYHCMLIYGWTKDGWRVRNSWGSRWGDSGNCIIPYDFALSEAYGITDNIINEDDIVKPYSHVCDFLIKIINWILNLFK